MARLQRRLGVRDRLKPEAGGRRRLLSAPLGPYHPDVALDGDRRAVGRRQLLQARENPLRGLGRRDPGDAAMRHPRGIVAQLDRVQPHFPQRPMAELADRDEALVFGGKRAARAGVPPQLAKPRETVDIALADKLAEPIEDLGRFW